MSEDKKKQLKNLTLSDTKVGLHIALAEPIVDKRPLHLTLAELSNIDTPIKLTPEKVEQARTTFKKNLAIDLWTRSRGVVAIVCKEADISRETFYKWLSEDKDFARKIQAIEKQKNDVASDMLWAKIVLEKDGASIRYYLDRKHPDYKPKKDIEIFSGERTLEDIIAEDAQKNKDEQDTKQQSEDGSNSIHEDEQVSNRKATKDTKQEGEESAVPAKSGAEVVLEAQDKKESDTKS